MDNFKIATLVDPHQVYEFYGVWGNFFKLGNLIFEALEDPDDGYRSHLDSVVMCAGDIKDEDGNVINDIQKRFWKKPIAKVRVAVNGNEIDVIDSTNNHIWLSIYTDTNCDYYPYFVFKYKVDETRKTLEFLEIEDLSPEIITAERFI